MTRRVALLLDDAENRYQQLLVREARATADRLGVALLGPEFARGSSWTQVDSVNHGEWRPPRPGPERPLVSTVARAGRVSVARR